MKLQLALPMAMVAIAGLAPQALAHMIETDFSLFDQELEFTSTFSTGEPVQDAQVIIYAPNNPDEPWGELTTDENGRFSFVPDASIPGDWEVRIEKDLGHEDIWTVPVNEIGIDYNSISNAEQDEAFFAINTPLALAGIVGLGTCMGIAVYASRKNQTA